MYDSRSGGLISPFASSSTKNFANPSVLSVPLSFKCSFNVLDNSSRFIVRGLTPSLIKEAVTDGFKPSITSDTLASYAFIAKTLSCVISMLLYPRIRTAL